MFHPLRGISPDLVVLLFGFVLWFGLFVSLSSGEITLARNSCFTLFAFAFLER